MVSSTLIDTDTRCRAIQARTDAAGAAVDDLSGEEDRLINEILTEGLVKPAAGWNLVPDTGMNLNLGSGNAKSDIYCVKGDAAGQLTYLVRLEATTVQVSVPPADGSQQRIDEVYLVVQDHPYDASNRGLPRIGYRTGDPGGGNPGPAAEWEAKALLWRVTVPAAATEILAGDLSDQRVTSKLSELLDGQYVATAGDTMTGDLLLNATRLRGAAARLELWSPDGANKVYVADGGIQMRPGDTQNTLFVTSGAVTAAVPVIVAATDGVEVQRSSRRLRALLADAPHDGVIDLFNSSDVIVARLRLGQDGTLKFGPGSGAALAADVARIISDTYTGNGAGTRDITGLPFTPKAVTVWTRDSTASPAEGRANNGTRGRILLVNQGTTELSQSVSMVTISGGFRVPSTLNGNGLVYAYDAVG